MNKTLISVIDDDEFTLDLLAQMLAEKQNFTVKTFESAFHAIDALNFNTPHQIILCDLNMPGMDGVEFLRYLSQVKYVGGLIVFSGEDARTLQAVKMLADAHGLNLLGALSKPVIGNTLVSLIESMGGNGSGMRASPPELNHADLEIALLSDAFIPFFQPQVDAITGKVVGVEALARLQQPSYGILGPGSFIPQAEESGLILALTDVMIVKSMKQWKKWHDAGHDLRMSVNVSMDCLARVDFPDWLVSQATLNGMPIDRLILEITESRVMQDVTKSLDVLSRLCLKRVKLSVDDFGTAYSNMEKLKMLPFFELKVDQSFVHDCANHPSQLKILESCVSLGKQLGMEIVAEGVESEEDWRVAALSGCGLIQGFYAARPMPGDELGKWIEEWQNQPWRVPKIAPHSAEVH